jgi:hypothetical protein
MPSWFTFHSGPVLPATFWPVHELRRVRPLRQVPTKVRMPAMLYDAGIPPKRRTSHGDPKPPVTNLACLRNVSKLTFTSSRRPLRVDPTRAAVASIDRDYGARAGQINGDFTGLDSPPSGLQLDFAGTPFLFERPRNWTCFRRRSAHAPGGPVDRVWAQKKADRFSRGSRPARRWQDRSACLAKPSSRPGRRERPLPASSCLHPSASADRARSSACRSCR